MPPAFARLHMLRGQVVQLPVMLCTCLHSLHRTWIANVARCAAPSGTWAYPRNSRVLLRDSQSGRARGEQALNHLQVGENPGKLGTVAAKELLELTEEVHST